MYANVNSRMDRESRSKQNVIAEEEEEEEETFFEESKEETCEVIEEVEEKLNCALPLSKADLVVQGSGEEVYQRPKPQSNGSSNHFFTFDQSHLVYDTPKSSSLHSLDTDLPTVPPELYDTVPEPRPVLFPKATELKTPKLLMQVEGKPRAMTTNDYDNPKRSARHYEVKNSRSGHSDVYAQPRGSQKTPKIPKPPRIKLPQQKQYCAPPLPPRNSPYQSPRISDSLESPKYNEFVDGALNMESMNCARCADGFEPRAKIVNSNGELFHPKCFVCAQCFRPFPDGVFYEFEGRKYCEHDFHVLFAPCCGKCGEFIIGRVIKAMNSTWHPQCFTCEMCYKELADLGFVKNQGRALCHECNAKVKAQGLGKHMCQRCHSVIDGEPLRFRGELYHPYHFNCTACGNELTSTAREVRTRPGYTANELNELYCLRCHDKMGIPICGACRRPIEERVVTALGKHWHVEHFVCAKCEKPFLGNRHYERKGLAYCETHYHQLFGNLCYVCNQVIQGDIFTALNKAWCVNHFACSSCDQKMTVKTKFYEVDLKPVCKKCYEKYPRELRLRMKKYHENEAARDQGGAAAQTK